MPITDHFTYGFELEGVFNQELTERECNETRTIKEGHFHQDGSVSIEDYFDELISDDNDDGYPAHEYSSPVLNSFEELMKYLSMFDENNYYTNHTCGFHLHIKPKDEEGERIKSIIASNAFLKNFKKQIFSVSKLQKIRESGYKDKEAFFDRHQVERLLNERSRHWCEPYSGETENIYAQWKHREKYRCIRNHPQGTLEFRLFSPFPGKEKRVASLFSIIESIVNKFDIVEAKEELPEKKTKSPTYVLEITKHKVQDIRNDEAFNGHNFFARRHFDFSQSVMDEFNLMNFTVPRSSRVRRSGFSTFFDAVNEEVAPVETPQTEWNDRTVRAWHDMERLIDCREREITPTDASSCFRVIEEYLCAMWVTRTIRYAYSAHTTEEVIRRRRELESIEENYRLAYREHVRRSQHQESPNLNWTTLNTSSPIF